MGITGHVCAFEQDINEFLNRLPRTKNDVSMLKVLKTVRAEIASDGDANIKAFRIRKRKVLDALLFLKQRNPLYADIEIDMTTLDWIDGDEGNMEGLIIQTEDILTGVDDNRKNADMGPAPVQANTATQKGDNVTAFGYLDIGGKAPVSDGDKEINQHLQGCVEKNSLGSQVVVDWPEISSVPVNEFGTKKIFALAFPWLFPGGEGDVKDFPGKNLTQWGSNLLHYKDGRFSRDKVFCFFAMNYIVRQRNSSSGRFFVDKFHRNCPETLEELKETINEGDVTFVNSLTYYNRRVKGSSPYGFQKRSEVYAWINHHIEAGNGPPMFFITLSCAEYFWPDIINLLKERIQLAGGDPERCYVGSEHLSEILNDYAIVVQEYFQKRVEIWMHTVGKQIFGIKHYWIRYEFAPGRGQIHAHLLAIPENQGIYHACYSVSKEMDGEHKRAELLSNWAKDVLGMTATAPPGFDGVAVDKNDSPCSIRFMDVAASDQARDRDCHRLLRYCQYHKCSQFCLSKAKDGMCVVQTKGV